MKINLVSNRNNLRDYRRLQDFTDERLSYEKYNTIYYIKKYQMYVMMEEKSLGDGLLRSCFVRPLMGDGIRDTRKDYTLPFHLLCHKYFSFSFCRCALFRPLVSPR